MITLLGKPYPLGATLMEEGVNFSLFAPFAERVELLLFASETDIEPKIIALQEAENKSYYYWHTFVPHIGTNQLYGYRVYGEHNPQKGYFFDPSKVLVDPYAKAIVGQNTREEAKRFGVDNVHNCLKSAVIDSSLFDWQNDRSPKFTKGKTIIYEMHLAGFTKSLSSDLPENVAGTFLGMIPKIPYLKELGITTVEFLPVFAFDADDAFQGKKNYWGYSPINFFAPHAAYASEREPQKVVDEFKTLVRELHKAGIEVLLDVVYNHTTENDDAGPTYSLRGIANNAYYLLSPDKKYLNFSGTGNTINANHSVVRRMIIDSLEYWVKEMHVDGFRFDLASALARDEDGNPIQNPPILWEIESNPALADVKLIAEPWDAAGLYQVTDFTGDKWAVWNAEYRDTMRAFLKGDGGTLQSAVHGLLGGEGFIQDLHYKFTADRNIHFITAHDGFTLHDLVAYNEKHNWDNGEENRDGHGDNLSWNCGVEGETQDADILALRLRQKKNALCFLFLSFGTPMMLMGDELGRTQSGNNNAYCQDNDLSWLDWKTVNASNELLDFTKQLIHFRRNSPMFRELIFPAWEQQENRVWVELHGVNQNDFRTDFEARSVGIRYRYGQEEIYWIINMHWQQQLFQLPKGISYKLQLATYEVDFGKLTDSVPVLGRGILVLKKV